jgi:hypothetical protein
MAFHNQSLFGLYADRSSADDAVNLLLDSGFEMTDISLLVPENLGTKDFGYEKHTKAPEGALVGGGSGAFIGGAVGWLAGMGALAVPGIGLAAAGPVMGMLGGIGAGSILGGLAGAISGASVPEYEAKRYEGRVRKGAILLSVHCDTPERCKYAQKVLRQTGAERIASAAEARTGTREIASAEYTRS